MIIKGTKLSMTRGDSETIKVARYDLAKALLPLAVGDTLYFTVKKSVKSEEIIIQKIITTFTDGKANILISPVDTSNLPFGTYWYDIQLNSLSGVVKTLVKPSEFEIEGEVTYD